MTAEPTAEDLIASVPPERADEMKRLLDVWGDVRESYGFPREGPPLTFAEMKEGETRNAENAARAMLREHADAADVGPTDYFDYWLRHGPVHDRDLPTFAYFTVRGLCYTAAGARDVVADAWSLPEWPEGNYGAKVWREMFALTGYFHAHNEVEDGEGDRVVAVYGAERPTEVPTLYRGAIHSRRKGMAWTSDRERAAWFANRWSPDPTGTAKHFKQGHVWRLDGVPPEKVLARFDVRGEHEWVLDTRGLTPIKEGSDG